LTHHGARESGSGCAKVMGQDPSYGCCFAWVATYTGLSPKGFYDFSVAAISAGGLTFATAVIVTLP